MQSANESLSGPGRLGVFNTLLAELLLGESCSVGVESEHDLLVAQRVLLLHNCTLGASLALRCAQHGLDFRGVDQTSNVCVGNSVGGQEEVLLKGGGSGGAAVDLIESLESSRGPDNEATQVTTGGELEEVESVDRGGLNTGDVAESADELLAVNLRVVDNERTTALAETAAPQLTLTGAHLLGLLDLNELFTGTDSLEELDGSLGLGESTTLKGLGFNNQRDLRNRGNAVTTGEKEGGNRGSSQGGSGSEAPRIGTIVSLPEKNVRLQETEKLLLLAKVDLAVPLSPDLGRSEHATRAALVTEGSLTSTVSTTTRDTRNTGDSTA